MGRRNRSKRMTSNAGWITPPPPPLPPAGTGWGDSFTRADWDRGIGRLNEYKRIIEEYDGITGRWVSKEEEAELPPPLDPDMVLELDRFCFLYRKQITPQGLTLPPVVSEYIEIKSWYLRKAGLEVIGTQTGISWYAGFLQLVPNQVLAYYPELKEYLKSIQDQPMKTEEDDILIAHLEVFLSFLAAEYRFLLAELEDLARTHETTNDRFWALYKPGKLYVSSSQLTGNPVVYRLLSGWTNQPLLSCEYFDMDGDEYIWSQAQVSVPMVFGRVPTTTLALYPLEHHPDVEEFKRTLIERGRKWSDLNGIHHKLYDGIAFLEDRSQEVMLQDRVMIDRESYRGRRTGPASMGGIDPVGGWGANPVPSGIPPPMDPFITTDPQLEPTDENLLLAPSYVEGFSLTDKRWFIFQIENVHEVTWDPLAFQQISMDVERKSLLQSLVEFHRKNSSFRDIVARKGRGLVINLFGPPGTGKTLTAEAISEYVHKPLYRVTAGELGTYSSMVSESLTRIFSLCARWDTIILLDEADIFLESRSTQEIDRNAMVSVFLKELEYFEGILFLTTNRIETFDPAFQSRIHVSLRYEPLSFRPRREIWVALLSRAGYDHDKDPLTEKELVNLASSVKNGREIRNIIRTAEAVAASRREPLGYRHLLQVKDVSNAFELSHTPKANPPQNNPAIRDRRTLQEKLVEDHLKGLLEFGGIMLFFFMVIIAILAGMVIYGKQLR